MSFERRLLGSNIIGLAAQLITPGFDVRDAVVGLLVVVGAMILTHPKAPQ